MITGRQKRPQQTADFCIALFVPTSGSAGLWGPSTIACAQLAAEELNRQGGLRGRPVILDVFNASDEAEDMVPSAQLAIEAGEVDAIVGMHTSSVRELLKQVSAGQVPFVYTPLYEGGEDTPGVFAIGERPEQQLAPSIRAMYQRYRTRRWMLLGNDYIWPRISHQLARHYIEECGSQVVDDCYLPFGIRDFGPIIDRIRRLKPQAILISLIGQDAIDFNRLFGQLGLARNTLRLSCAIEENGLLAIGADNSDGLHVAAGYFASLATDDNLDFKERYYGRYGSRAPTLNALGQSTYEGVHFVAALEAVAHKTRGPRPATIRATADPLGPLQWRSVRGTRYLDNQRSEQTVYLARANGHVFEVLQTL